MEVITIHVAKTNLSQLLRGVIHVDNAFFEPLPEAELAEWK